MSIDLNVKNTVKDLLPSVLPCHLSQNVKIKGHNVCKLSTGCLSNRILNISVTFLAYSQKAQDKYGISAHVERFIFS